MKTVAAERFWKKVTRTDGCWIWTGALNPYRGGYGIFWVGESGTTSAHRFSYELANGPVPPGLVVCHTCDNPPCVRPDHLFVGSDADNAADMIAKGRKAPPNRKLTPDDVRTARALHAAGAMSIKGLGRRFAVHEATMRAILRGITYASVT